MDEQQRNQYQPDYAVSPGEVLNFELQMRGIKKNALAKRTGLTPKHISDLLNAKSSLTVETAIKLERAMGMPVQFWMNLETEYGEALARLAEKNRLKRDLSWLKRLPVAAMIKLGWIKKSPDPSTQLVNVLEFFGIAGVDQWGAVWPGLQVAYRQHAGKVSPEALSAWLRRGEIEAANMECAPFDKAKFRHALDQIRLLTCEAPEVSLPAMRAHCAQAGVAVVFVPTLPGVAASGATRWLTPTKALMQLSARYQTDDQLWFAFFHEAGHILLHSKKAVFLEGMNGLDPDEEDQANQFAQNELIPSKAWDEWVKQPAITEGAVRRFAAEWQIAPGIVVGRLQHHRRWPYARGNALKQRVRLAFDATGAWA